VIQLKSVYNNLCDTIAYLQKFYDSYSYVPKTGAAFDWFVAHSSTLLSTQHGMGKEIIDEPEWQHQQYKHCKKRDVIF
jgi:hypothetical protein